MNIIFTDGSSRGNPGPGGWGAIIKMGEEVRELGGAEKNTTNNRMELTAVIEALKFVSSVKTEDKTSITIFSDSKYVIDGITKWRMSWQKNNWRTSAKKPVLNKELWQVLIAVVDELKQSSELQWTYVEGHAGTPGNERCDEIATSFADENSVTLYGGSAKGYPVDIAS